MPTTLRLEDDITGNSVTMHYNTWTPGTDVNVSSYDLGFPNAREVIDDFPGRSGTIDNTSYFGARSVSLSAVIYGGSESKESLLLKLRSMCSPARNPRLYILNDVIGIEQKMELRGSNFSAPMGSEAASRYKVELEFVCPSGVIESYSPYSTSVTPEAVPGEGNAFDYTFDVDFGALVDGEGFANVNVVGTEDTPPTFTIYDSTDPVITLVSSGEQITFTGLVIASGNWVQVDVENRIVTDNYGANMYDYLDLTATSWFNLEPGVNSIRFSPITAGSNGRLDIDYTARWL